MNTPTITAEALVNAGKIAEDLLGIPDLDKLAKLALTGRALQGILARSGDFRPLQARVDEALEAGRLAFDGFDRNQPP